MKVVTTAEMREIDRVTSERFGVPSLALMENAGTAVAEVALARFPDARQIAVVCGKGNNGGDGMVAARKLHEAGKKVSVLLLADRGELRGDAAHMCRRMPLRARSVDSAHELRRALSVDLVIDAILGSGFRPPVTGLYAEAIQVMNSCPSPIVAVDIPSGWDADAQSANHSGPVARADAVVTFTAPRPAHVFAPLTRGPIVVAPIGSPEAAIVSSLRVNVATAREIEPLFAPRKPDAHKGDFGHVLIIGGSLGKAGAAAMAGMAALRVGAGLSTVATPKSVLPIVGGFAPEIMTEHLAETDAGTISGRALDYDRLEELAAGKDVVAIGPGISRNSETVEFVRRAVDILNLPLVIDADGLNAFEGCATKLDGSQRPLVLTPHPGEMARLTGLSTGEIQRDRVDVARKFAKEHSATVVLKGHRTIIAEPEGAVWINMTGNPGMATGGTGDVLTGMIAGLIAQYPSAVEAAVAAAVYLHGLAGDVARNVVGEQALVATDLLSMMPMALDRIHRRAAEKYTVLCE
jgi:NAD(P)H-hydrate epimerase